MILAGNQPYFVPYLGYWQLINAADTFVFADDYHYIMHGWINRNRILINGSSAYFNIELSKASSNKMINEIMISETFRPSVKLKQIYFAYRNAPFFNDSMQVVEDIMLYPNRNLSLFLKNSIDIITDFLDINTKIVMSSDFHQPRSLKREERIYDFCKQLSADTYINACGGERLYSKEEFNKNGLELLFLKAQSLFLWDLGFRS